MDRHRKRLEGLFKPETKLREQALPSDVRKVIVGEEEQQEWSSSLDQEDPEPPHIKEEQEELWSSQEGDQLQGLEEADITKFTFTPVPVKSEDDEEKPQSSQMETEADGEDCGGPQPDRNSHPDTHVTPETEDKTGDSSEPETDDSDDWTVPSESQSALKPNKVPVSDKGCHTGLKPLSCPVCKKCFKYRAAFVKHKRLHTREKASISCVSETKQSGSNSLKDVEVPASDSECSAGEKPFSCSECGKTFGFNQSLTRHMRSHTGEKPFCCAQCGKRFVLKGSLTRHMRSHTGEKSFSCSVCNKSFAESGSLKKHKIIHTGEKPFSCSICNERFVRRYQLKKHEVVSCHSSQLHQRQTEQMKTEVDGEDCGGPEPDRNSHPDTYLKPETEVGDDLKETKEPQPGLNTLKDDEVPVSDSSCSAGKKPFLCSECGKRFGLKGSLMRHIRVHTGEKPFSCLVCNKSFAESGGLKKHKIIHTGEKPFSCSVCNKSFAASGGLKKHKIVHTGEKPFSCSLCGKRFCRQTHLKEHRRTHTGEKPFSCLECGKKFGRKTHLKEHMGSHMIEKPFRCSVCDKRFWKKVNLKYHMRTHTGEKPSSCSECGKRFCRKTYLKQHMITHTGEKPFSCSVCNKSFAWPQQLKKHVLVSCQSSQCHQRQTEQMETEADGENCGGPEPDRNSHPDTHVTPETEDKTGDSSEPETDDSDDWKKTREPQSGLNSLKDDEVPVSDERCSAGEKPFSCSECGKRFGRKDHLKRHMVSHTAEKPFSCSLCKKTFTQSGSLQSHIRIHTGEKPFCCSICNKRFAWPQQLKKHKCVGHQSSQMETEADGEDCGGPQPDRNSHPDTHVTPETEDKTGDSSEPERPFCSKGLSQ